MEVAKVLLDRLFPRYECFAVLGASGGEKAWFWSVWSQIYPAVSGLAGVLETAASVHSRQVQGLRSAEVRFGSMQWSEEGQQRWAHYSPANAAECGKWLFVDAEIFMPARQQLISGRGSQFPVVYMQLSGVVDVPNRQTAYDQRVLLCVRLDAFRTHERAVRALLKLIQSRVKSVATLSQVRRVLSLNEFESILRKDLDYRGVHEDPLPDLSKTEGRWAIDSQTHDDG